MYRRHGETERETNKREGDRDRETKTERQTERKITEASKKNTNAHRETRETQVISQTKDRQVGRQTDKPSIRVLSRLT